jgi:conjugative relaxase-like TrwC/TraI family protein
MLNVTPQRSSEAAKSYFAQSDYYAEGQQEIIGEWGGKGAVLAGLFGQVDKRAFDSLCDNLHPRTSEPLTPITRGNRRTGYDFTWSAPKSVSVVESLTGDERIVDAFRASVRETMHEMEADMQARVRKGKASADRTTGNMLWAEFVHRTSRPVGGIPSPQLHVHAFAMNVTFDPVESAWKAGQFGRIKSDAYYWQAVQQTRFASKLQSLGYAVRKTKDAFEIAQVPGSVIHTFSPRTGVIERMAAELGITDPKIKAKLGATTREAKNKSIPYDELVSRWLSQVTPGERAAVFGARSSAAVPAEHNDARHVAFAIEHSFERASVVDERRLLTTALRHGVGEVTPEGVRAETARLKLLHREEDGKRFVTTRKVLAEERRMIAYAASGKSAVKPIVGEGTDWRNAMASSGLSDEQRAAVTHVLTSPDRVMILTGVAGSGKTTLTREAVRQVESTGRNVVMLAPSAQASRGVLRDEGFATADTLARFLIDEKLQASARDGMIWLDEAGLVGSRTMGALFDKAKELNARVVLAGDKDQMKSVERGDALRLLEQVAGLKVAKVREIRRQQVNEYKEAVRLLARGDSAEALERLDALGWVKTLPVGDRYTSVARDYIDKRTASSDPDKAVLIVSPTHAEAEKITAELRRQMREAGLLGRDEHELERLVPLQWTEAERADRRHYAGDEVLQFHRNSGEFKAGERVESATMLTAVQPPRASNFTVYGKSSLRLSRGDLIRVTANGKTKDGRHKLNNGSVYRVRGFSAGGDIELANGWIVDRSFGHLASGYVSTAHAAQGRTADHVIVVQSELSSPAASREGFYVAVSRGRKTATVWTGDRAALTEMAQRHTPRLAAAELFDKRKPSLRERAGRVLVRTRHAAALAMKAAAWPVKLKEPEVAHAR